MEATTYAQAVGTFVRAYRQQHAITLESIARRGRDLGATWSLSSVQAIEAGKASPTLPTLLTLALVLGDLSGKSLTLVDLLGQAEVFDRPFSGRPELPVRRSLAERALRGGKVEMTDEDAAPPFEGPFGPEVDDERIRPAGDRLRPYVVDEKLDDEVNRRDGRALTPVEHSDMLDQMIDAYQEPPEPDWDDEDDLHPPSLAEQRAAKKLDLDPAELRHWAEELWGRGLEDESAHRAGPDSSPQARGRVTRLLVDEIRAAIEEEG